MAEYDVIVIGGGSAGSSAAAAAAEAGARTAMINDGELGGLCILRGCMPTKAMLETAHAIHVAERLEPFGARLEGRVVADFARIMERKNRLVERFKRAKVESIESSDFEVIPGRGKFVAGPAVEVEGRRLEAASFVVSTGSTPAFLPIPGIESVPVLTSDDVMRLDRMPRSLLVLGAGAVGLELSQFFARLGCEVTIVNRSPLLEKLDAAAGEELRRALEADGRLQVVAPGMIEKLIPRGDGMAASIQSGADLIERNAEALLMAVGRRPLLDDLGLEHVGLEIENGSLYHDEKMRTRNPRVYVAGDATGASQILHVSNLEGRVAGHNAAGAKPLRSFLDRFRMQVVFTDPPYASVGCFADDSAGLGVDTVVGCIRFPETGRAITMETDHGLWRMCADRTSGKILGSSILGPRADDLIHEVALLMHYGATVDDLFELPWYHPTLSEVMIDLARDLKRRIITG